MPTSTEILASYVPSLVSRAIERDPAPRAEPSALAFPAAVLFADITGFTALTERLDESGPSGAEEITSILNAYFEPLVALVRGHGGDIVKFAGDALLAVFPESDEPVIEGSTDAGSGGRLRAVTLRAAHCGATIQEALGGYEAAPGISLQVRVGIGVGEVATFSIGGVAERWELLVTGSPLSQVSHAENLASPGEVILSREAWALIAPAADGQPLDGGYARLARVREPLPVRALPAVNLGPSAEPALRAYLPAIITARIDAGHERWLAELRRVTALFITIEDLTEGVSLELSHKGIRAVQTILERYEGTLTRLGADDKGVTLLVAFGLPMLAHEDDAYRAVQAALSIQAALTEEGMRGAIGVTTGRAYCGVVGSSVRHEYTMIGDSVNVAARLMQAAAASRVGVATPVYCDETTRPLASARVRFSSEQTIAIKGKADRVSVVEPLGSGRSPSANGSKKAREALVGRASERQRLHEALLLQKSQAKGGVILLAGEAGMGKSRLVTDLLGQASEVRLSHLVAAGDAIDKSNAYHAYGPVFHALFGLDSVPEDRAAKREHVLSQIRQKTPEVAGLAPLLNAVLSLDIPEDEITAQMTGRVRADNTRELLLRLLEAHQGPSGSILAVEDAHWLDSASWALTLAVSERIPNLLLLIATRPLPDPVPEEYRKLRDAPGTLRLDLAGMALEEAITLVKERLSVTALPEPVVALIADKAQGNPFFSEELAYALRDSGLILIEDGECRLAPEASDLSSLHFPDTIQGVVTSRIDRLPPAEQLTLKVASVIGRIFSYKALLEIHPVEADRTSLSSYLTELEHLEFTPQESAEPELAYIFKHVITQEVAYNLMVFAQRRQLHRGVAEWYERTYAEDLSPYYPYLAHHWKKVVETGAKEEHALQKALSYLEKAGDQALSRFANKEALAFFDAALELKKEVRHAGLVFFSDGEGQAISDASLVRRKGTALLGASQFGAAVEAFELSLATLGAPPVHDRKELVTFSEPVEPPILPPEIEDAVIKQDAERLFHLLWPDPAVRERLLTDEDFAAETLLTYEQLPELYYFSRGPSVVIEAALRTISIAEKRASFDLKAAEPVLAKAYTIVTWALVGQPHLYRVADLYFDKAMKATDGANQLAVSAYTCLIMSSYAVSVGNLGLTKRLVEKAIDAAHRIGDPRREVYALVAKAGVLYHQSRFSESAEVAATAHDIARRIQDLPGQIGGLVIQSRALLMMGGGAKVQEVTPLLERAEQMLGPYMPKDVKVSVHGAHAILHWHSGDHERARQAICQDSIVDCRLKSGVGLVIGYLGFIEAALSLLEAETAAGQAAESTAAAARSACDALNINAEALPVLKPHALRSEGLYQHLFGDKAKALALWKESIDTAERVGSRYGEALARYEIGRHLPLSDSERKPHLDRAARIFSDSGAAHHLKLTQAELTKQFSTPAS